VNAEEIARFLVRAGAVEVRPDPEGWFVWSSGRRAPIYCDNRVLLGIPEGRTRVADALALAIRERFERPGAIAGTATAGIAWAALVAERLELPMVYVRPSRKEHGREQAIEGRLGAGARVVVVEDLISTGGSSGAAVEELRKAGAEVLGVQAIFSYALPEAELRFEELGVVARSLSDYPTLLRTLPLSAVQARALHEWRAR
jgi:orotate phosphoribosyltransferase